MDNSLELVKISNFPESTDVKEWVVVSDASGNAYKVTRDNFKAFLGTVQSIAPRPIAPTDPAPTLDGVYIPTVTQNEAGMPIVYGNAGGLSVNTAEGGEDYGMSVQLINNGSEWVKISLPLPQIDIVDNLTTNEANKALSAKQGFEIEPRILPEGNEFDTIDRPDIKNFPIVDKDFNILKYLKTTTTPNDEFDYSLIDRPDLVFVITDKDGRIFWQQSSNPAQVNGDVAIHGFYRPDLKRVVIGSDSSIIERDSINKDRFGFDFLTFVNPTTKPDFNVETTDPWGNNYEELLLKFDEVMDAANSNPDVPIMEKGIYGSSGSTATPLTYYRLKSSLDPKVKILLSSGMHAVEKMYFFAFYQILKDLTEAPFQHPTIQWIRENCEIVFIPCVCPDTIGFPEKKNGSRTVPETSPIPSTYSDNGEIVTLTYTESDFPTLNSALVWDDYFKPQPDRRWITIWETDNPANLPRGRYEYTVINGHTITIASLSGVVSNGTCDLQMWADPNRNVDNGTGLYQSAVQTVGDQFLDDGTNFSTFDSKGTNGNTLQEIRDYISFLDIEGFDIVIDGHCPPADHYVTQSVDRLMPNNFQNMAAIKAFQSMFNPAPFIENITKRNASISGVGVTASPMWSTKFSGAGLTIEWSQGLVYSSSERLTNATRWAYSVLVGFLKYSAINNKQI